MMDNVSVFRTGEGIKKAIEKIKELKERYQEIKIDDKGKKFNTDLIEAIELGNLLDTAESIAEKQALLTGTLSPNGLFGSFGFVCPPNGL